MKAVKRWRYYCDHCKKVGGHRHVIERHESSCVRNPNRICRMCQMMDVTQQPTEALRVALRNGGVASVREVAQGCPACILAAIVGSRNALIAQGNWDHPEDWSTFDFKKEMDSAMSECNDKRRRCEYGY